MRKTNEGQTAKKAFTLVAILAAILFPVFAQAKEAAKKTSCLSNMKQFGTAFNIYSTDADDNVICPGTTVVSNGVWDRLSWDRIAQPYVKNYDIFACPDDSVSPKVKAPWGATVRRSYSMPTNLGYDWTVSGDQSKNYGSYGSTAPSPGSPRSPSSSSSETIQHDR